MRLFYRENQQFCRKSTRQISKLTSDGGIKMKKKIMFNIKY